MAYVAFPNIQLSFGPHNDRQNELRLSVPASDSERILEGFNLWVLNPTSELKLELTQGWTLYFKIREGESRQYLSHPEDEIWVATFALSADHAVLLLDKLRTKDNEYFETGSLGTVQSLSNLELSWRFL